MPESFIGTCFMCGDEIPSGAYCSEACRKEHESIIEARPRKETTDGRPLYRRHPLCPKCGTCIGVHGGCDCTPAWKPAVDTVDHLNEAPQDYRDYLKDWPTSCLQIAGRIWCDPEMSDLLMDAGVAKKIAKLLESLRDGQPAPNPSR